jgi:hypothetical protein
VPVPLKTESGFLFLFLMLVSSYREQVWPINGRLKQEIGERVVRPSSTIIVGLDKGIICNYHYSEGKRGDDYLGGIVHRQYLLNDPSS